MDQFLDGIRILEIGALTAGPNCARMLSNMGAEVIKIEQPKVGEVGRRYGSKEDAQGYLEIQNYNKKSIGLNLGTPQGQEIMRRLLAVSDILVQNLAPNAVERWGLAPEETCAKYPRLIYCSVNGFGRNGLLRMKRALDTVLQSWSGVMSMTGVAGGVPLKSGVSSADASGSAAAAASILAALYYRNRTGQGQVIDTAMLDVMGWMTMTAWPDSMAGRGAERTGNRSFEVAPQNVYQCRDGYLAISVQTDRQWQALQRLLAQAGQPAWPGVATLAERIARQQEIDQAISAWTGGQSAAVLEQTLQQAGIPAAKVLEVHEVFADQQVLEREMVVSLRDRNGDQARVLNCPVRGSEAAPVVSSGAPAVGGNNYEIYHQLLGFSEAEMAQWRELGVI
jgi:crotonobetainyl-CoA:carnitine CoA-transferase CaiB-like acyl-CoA transferase